MALVPIGAGGFDYVQDTAPSSPDVGETWYDTSEAEARDRPHIYADVGNGNEWVNIPTLEQSDILSDGTPFPGGNIDAAISTRATPSDTGTDFSTKSGEVSAGTTSHDGNTLYDITGSGILIALLRSGGSSSFAVEIDGGSIYNVSITDAGLPLFWQFDSSLTVTSDNSSNSGNNAVVVLD